MAVDAKDEGVTRDLGGRPRIELNDEDMQKIQGMVQILCTAEEICGVLDISADTLDRRLKEMGYAGFADYFKKHSHNGKASLRRKQYELATKGNGNATMLIWLGKQMLGQADKSEFSGPEGDPIPFTGFIIDRVQAEGEDG